MSHKRKIESVMTMWWYTPKNGEEYESYTVGEDGVTEIEYFTPRNARPYVDIHFRDGTKKRSYKIEQLAFSAKEE